MAKRLTDDDDSYSPNKRQKTGGILDSIVEKIFTAVETVNSMYPDDPAPQLLTKSYINLTLTEASQSTFVSNATASIEDVKRYLRLFKESKENDTPHIAWFTVSANLRFVDKWLDDFQAALLKKPPPLSYAKRAGWENAQQRPGALLCLRPPGMQGLPLALLHYIFSTFQRYCLRELPASPEGSRALQAALDLCNSMGGAFESEGARGKMFDNHVSPFLQKALVEHTVDGDSGRVDRVYFVKDTPLMIREDKNEYETGDAHFQVSRSYDLVCETLAESVRTRGVPAFLLSIMGPSLTISGGFKDGPHTVVEPLCPTLPMLQDKDKQRGRSVQLAQHLLALKDCLEILGKAVHVQQNLSGPSTLGLIPGCPRVFPFFKDMADNTHSLDFITPLPGEHLLFAAKIDVTKEAFVKIVYGPYGVEVHNILSKTGHAPELFGTASVEGGPTMIVMETLDGSQWQALYEFAQGKLWRDAAVRSVIAEQLRAIVKRLEDEGLVHGDLRSNNVMVKMDISTSMLVDFDWAGKAGEVKYPLGRNEEIAWPKPVGSPITLGDDSTMLEQLLKELAP